MKIYLPNFEPSRQGGGWSFQSNFAKGFQKLFKDMDSPIITNDYIEADIYFICGSSMVERSEVQKAKQSGKKIVLRVDNALRNSRNRGTGMTRMKDFAEMADLVIYQSIWARDFLYPYLKKDGAVILNGVDTEIFKPSETPPPDDAYLYVRSSRDEGKQWIMAWYWFVNHSGRLEIAGKFSPENLEWKFDFYNGENIFYTGEHRNMAEVYQRNKYFLYTYLNDACSNMLLEARASGCEIIDVYGMLQTGGAREIMDCKDISLERMCKEYEECLQAIV